MYHPATNEPAMEWVEFYNQMAVDLDISDWSIQGGIQYTFPSNTIVRGGGYLVVAISPADLSTLTGLAGVYGPFTGRLGNNGDRLELRNNSGWLMDEVTYGVEDDWPVASDGSGASLAKIDPESASAPAANWAASSQVGGTPGTKNFPRTDEFIAPPGLVSYWNFDEAGTTAQDRAGQNNGVFGTGASRVAGSASFNGTSNAFVNFGPGTSQGSFAVSSGVAIELVVKPNWNGSNTAVLFAKAPARPASYRDTVLASRPLAYWRLDDTNTTIRDASTYSRHGTATAGVLLRQSSLIPSEPTNAAARFGGSERAIVTGFEKIGAAGYSVEFWVKPHALPTSCCQNLVGDGEAAGDYFLMNYILGPVQGLVGAVRPHYGPANTPVSMSSPTALRVGNVYHVVTTWDARSSANNAVIYLNAVADCVGTTTINLPAAGTTGANRVYLGKDDRDTDATAGTNTLDEVALYNYPLTAADVAAHYLAATAVDFDLNLGNALQLAFQNDGRNAQANPPVPAGPVLSFGLVVGGVYSELDMPLDGQEGRPTLAALQDGAPHHVAATYDSVTGLKGIFVDGVLRFSTTLSGLINATNGANAVAGNTSVPGTNAYTGTMDNLAFWGRTLSASELAAHAAAMQAGYDYFTPTSRVEVARLAFNEVSSSTNSDFWLELINYGTNQLLLDGLVLSHDGATSTAYVFPTNGLSLAPGGFLVLSDTTLGFHPDSGDKLYLYAPTRTHVLDGVVAKRTLRGRHPDGTGFWLRPSAPTSGASNSFTFHDQIVINEIMYHHARLPSTNNLPPQESPEQWIELYNRGPNAVDLTGWQLAGGIEYQFAAGKTIASGGYLVIAKNSASLRPLYPSIDLVGDFNGTLSGKSDRMVLLDAAGNPADEVRYCDGHPWPEYPDGGGSSLELRNPDADNSKPETWAASDETRKTAWQTYSYRMVASIPTGSGQPTQWNDFIFGLLGEGECLIDDLSVVESPATTPVAFIANGDFENGLTGWRLPGDHGHSRLETDPENPGNHVLHVIATGPQEHMHNHVETTYISGRSVVNGREYQISFRARWLAGNPFLNTRLYFNRVARTTALPMPALNGTPGAPNSRSEANLGPTFSQLQHQPVVPQPGAPVTVSVLAEDPQGVGSGQLFWSANSGAWSSTPLTLQSSGYTGTIPGYAAGTIVQFYVRAVDGLGATSTYPAAGPASGALYVVEDGQDNLALGHNFRILLSPANRALLHAFTNVMSNDNLPCTVIYDEQHAYYDLTVRLKGSERGRYSNTRVSFHLNFRSDDLFRGVHPVMLLDRSGAGDATYNRQEEILIRHMLLRAGNIPGTYPDLCRVIAPFSTHTGSAILAPRHEDKFIESAFANGGDGTEFELELIYYPTTANAAGYKNPNPDSVVGTDISDLGNDKEIYRYNFILKNHRDADDYAPFMAFAKTLSLNDTALDQATRGVMDVEEWLRAWALVTLCAVGDSYTFGNNHNLLMYLRPSDQKMLAFPVDMDFTFTRGASGALIGNMNFSKIINLTPNLRVFYAHLLDIMGSSFNTSYMAYWVPHYMKFLPGQDFTVNSGSIPAALPFIQSRGDFVRSSIAGAGGNIAFAVNGSANLTVSSNLLILTGTAPFVARTVRVNGRLYPLTWISTTTWRLQVPLSEATNVLKITAYDVRGQALSNLSSTVTAVFTGAVARAEDHVVFNEIMYQPAVPEAAYVELYNTSDSFAFDLAGYRINGLDFTFAEPSVILPRGCLLLVKNQTVFAATYGTTVFPHAQFAGNLDRGGETLTLIRPGAVPEEDVIVDRVRYDDEPPWPAGAAGSGSSLQLLDATRENSRVSNWSDGEWRFFSYSGKLGGTNLYLFLNTAGDVYIDNLMVVTGAVAEAGPNQVINGDFESPFALPWEALGAYSNTTVSTEIAHSGQGSLHLMGARSGTINHAVVQRFPAVIATNTHTLSFWYRSGTNVPSLTLTARFGSLFMPPPISISPIILTPGVANGLGGALPAYPPLWLNEIQPDNPNGIQDSAGDRDPWIELYNAGTNVVSLEGFTLANNYTNLGQWTFPAGASIGPGEFKIIWADGEPGETSGAEFHTSFRLNQSTGAVALCRGGEALEIVDYLNYADVASALTYGDYPDGQPFYRQVLLLPTPGTNNQARALNLFFNEWLALNTQHSLDPADGDTEDWFEIYNPGTNPVDLAGCYLTDSFSNKTQFRIPTGYVVPARGFLLVWADEETGQNNSNRLDLHVNFRLSGNGESLGLYTPELQTVDEIDFGPQTNNVSQGRFPDGAGTIEFMTQPTPRAPNLFGGDNTAPSLDPVADQFISPGVTLRVTVTAQDPEAPPQSLRFSLDPDAPDGAVIDAESGEFTWTPDLAQCPSTNAITVRVTDDGQPPRSGTTTFVVTVVSGPVVAIRNSSGNIAITFPTTPGKRYRVDYKNDLNEVIWTPLGDSIVAGGTSLTINDQIGDHPQRFYRIVQLD